MRCGTFTVVVLRRFAVKVALAGGHSGLPFNPRFAFDFLRFGTIFAPNPSKTGVRTLNMPS